MVDGTRVFEIVFLHRPSRTLIVTDLLFHVVAAPSWKTRLLFRMAGVLGKLTTSRALRLLTTDRTALRASLAHILTRDFDRLVMAHGDIIDTGAKSRVQASVAAV